jgi:hypothetical protein
MEREDGSVGGSGRGQRQEEPDDLRPRGIEYYFALPSLRTAISVARTHCWNCHRHGPFLGPVSLWHRRTR